MQLYGFLAACRSEFAHSGWAPWSARSLRLIARGRGPLSAARLCPQLALYTVFGACVVQVGTAQFGARAQDGVCQMIAHISASMELEPSCVVVCTDARSALGSALRSAVWKAAIDGCPRLAWGHAYTMWPWAATNMGRRRRRLLRVHLHEARRRVGWASEHATIRNVRWFH